MNGTLNSSSSNSLAKNTKSTTEVVLSAFKQLVNFGAVFVTLKKAWGIISDISSEYIDMVETNNLFEVTMGKTVDEYGNLDEAASQYYTRALEFQEEMNEKLATNKSELMEYQSIFYSLFKNQGVDLDSSYLMSESLTKAGYDIASLYNLDVDTAMSSLQSAITGQIKSLRSIGIDVSETSIQSLLDNLGIDRTVDQLSYAEKEVARYISIMQQASQAQGDFAKTFESPANQLKVFTNQISELKQVAGSFIINTFGNLITYANAVVMVIKELLTSLAELFGYDLDTSSSTSSLSDSLGVSDLSDDLDDATSSAKELKKQLMGFDEINNITPNTSSSSGSSGGSSSYGIDDKLLDALTEWDNMMDSISGKAQEIRDKLLDWLGVTDGSYENLKKILEVVKTVGVALASWTVSNTIANLLKNLGVLNSTQAFQLAFGVTLAITGIYAMYNGIKRLLSGDITLFSILETLFGAGASTLGIAYIVKSMSKNNAIKMTDALQIGFGITLAIAGFIVAYNGIQKLLDGDVTLQNILEAVGGSVATGVGLAMSISKIVNLLSKGGTTVNLGTSLAIGFGITLLITSISVLKDGLEDDNLSETILGALGVGSSLIVTINNLAKAFGTDLKTKLTGLISVFKNFNTTVSTTTYTIEGNTAVVAKNTASVSSLVTSLGKFVLKASAVVAGVLLIIDSLKSAVSNMQDFSNGLISADDAMGNAMLSMAEMAVGGAALGAVIGGPVGAAIGALAGGIVSVTTSIVTFVTAESEAEKESEALREEIEELQDSYEETKNSIQETYDANLEEISGLQALSSELGTLVDSNGNVIEGNEALVDTILTELNEALDDEYTRIGNVIYKNGEAVTSYDGLMGTIDEYIAQMEQEAICEYYKDLYVAAIKERQAALDELKEAQNAYDEARKTGDEDLQASCLETLQVAVDAYSTACLEASDCADNLKKYSQSASEAITDNTQTTSDDITNQISSTTDEITSQVEDTTDDITEQVEDMNSDLESTTTETSKNITNNVSGLSDELVEAYTTMAQNSESNFSEAIEKLPDDTEGALLASIIATEGMNSSTETAYKNLSSTAREAFNKAIENLDDDAKNKVSDALNEITHQSGSASYAGKTTGSSASSGFGSGLGSASSSATYFLTGFLTVLSSGGAAGPVGIFTAVSTLTSKIIKKFNSGLGISSPSKLTKETAKYFAEGFINQIDTSSVEMVKQVGDLASDLTDSFDDNIEITDSLKELSQGIKVDTKDIEIDTNQFVKYSSVNGQIQEQIKVAFEDVSDKIYTAVVNGMKDSSVQVDITAKTDEGVIVKTATEGIKDYVYRTGELPFPVPV